ncbi:electron transport complex protein RnfC [Alkalibaculum sp. M08DMB]|uniref:Electron transport complex protein RnfC n=1 Tax=Alkalibaculum sporogenes TaxID=2655001 RepID=A0A6A7K809_9FIRM|nr:4Fe-4S dicluster domain-containing protein [Alkalibaculum sporogenes]MPW25516.1 electron transport complex protein RnfC [Alkalibaculum sporogenes]
MEIKFSDMIKEAGVVGAGGAGFPTNVKLSSKSEYIIVNAAECEPLIRVDQQLLLHYTDDFLAGLQIIADEVQASKAYIAIKAKHTEVIHQLNKKLVNYPSIEIYPLQNFYPAGDEQIIVYEVLKKVVPRGGIPLHVGCIVCNVETVINVYGATKGKSVTSTFVTITGEVNKPSTYELPIGMSFKDALALCGEENLENKVGILNGAMMGNIITDFEMPITKTTKAIILLNSKHLLIKEKSKTIEQVLKQSRIACIQCQKCTDLCPRDLLGHDVKPHKVMRIANYGLTDYSGMKTALGCSECGACELYSCPNGLSPRQVNKMIKQELRNAGVKIDNEGKEFSASQMIEYRKIPVNRLISRINLEKYDVPAPLISHNYDLKKVVIPLNQHQGAPAIRIVEQNTYVEKGQMIAKIDGDKLGANIHASIAGIVTDISSDSITIESEMEVK